MLGIEFKSSRSICLSVCLSVCLSALHVEILYWVRNLLNKTFRGDFKIRMKDFGKDLLGLTKKRKHFHALN